MHIYIDNACPQINCMDTDNQHIFFGTSGGEIYSLKVFKNKIINSSIIYKHSDEINCCIKYTSMIYFGCNDGSILCYNISTNACDIFIKPSTNMIPCTCININYNYNYLIIGFATGHIKIQHIFNPKDAIQFHLHRRLLTGLHILQQKNLIATVSEDGYVHVISLNSLDNLNINIIKSLHFPNTILVGVEFLPISNADISVNDCCLIITAYDRNKLVFV